MLAAHRARPTDRVSTGEHEGLESVEVCPLSGARPTAACPHMRRELFVAGHAPSETCDMHLLARIDVRNGLLAGAGCPSSFVEERAYESFDASFALWAKSAARPLAPDTFSPLCPKGSTDPAPRSASPGDASRARLAFPFNGAKFVYDDGASSRQVLTLRAEAPKAATTVRFYIDGRFVDAKRAPFLLEWPLVRGTHLARAEADIGEPSDPVEFVVR
jgi:penicillin-binding protein 1C